MSDQIKLGARVRDRISGWTGIATARYEYMNGCLRWEISGADDKGAPVGYVFDQQQLELAPDAATPDVTPAPRRTGGPTDSAPVAR